MKKTGILLLLFAIRLLGAADAVELNPYGDLRLGGDMNLFWFHAGPNWSSNKRMNRTTLTPGKITGGEAAKSLAGRFAVNGGEGFDFQCRLERKSGGEWLYRASFVSEKPVDGMLYLAMDVPVDKGFAPLVDGAKIAMPEKFGSLMIWETAKGKLTNSVSFQTAAGQITVTGAFAVRLQDNRRFRQDFYNLRLIFPGCTGAVTRAEVTFSIRLDTLRSTPIDLAAAANMGLADASADDGQGGWTDQGPENDMVCLPVGPLNLSGIDFNIADPAENRKRSCVVVSGHPSRRYPAAGAVVLAEPEAHSYLYILHGAAWVPAYREEVGAVAVEYADGSRSRHPVCNGVDVGNWWRPSMSYPNAFLEWRGENVGGPVGLFVSHFRLSGKPVKSIRFEPRRGVWAVVAASFANLPLERPKEKPYVVTAGKEWSPIEFDGSVQKGSPLDFSRFADAPAGKYGWVKMNPQGHFYFEKQPGETVRFWGTNLAQSALFPTHAEADKLAETLVANGYNSVRLHQFERGLMDRRADDTLTFDPEKLDRFFYLISALKARGLYLCTDIFATRPIRPGDRIEECRSADGMERKVLNFFSPSAMRNWQEYARKLLTTPNPYTGVSLAEEPALYMVCLDNEAPILETWNQFPLVAHIPEAAFRRHLQERKLTAPTDKEAYVRQFRRYLAERQLATQREQKDFLSRLGCRFLTTNLNNDAMPELQPLRQDLELVDIHSYHDHPIYPQARWGVPVAFRQHSPIAFELRSLTNCSAARIFGKPFVMTEMDFCAPNMFRGVGGVLTGAYSSLQDWDAVYRFGYTHSVDNLRKPGRLFGFDTVFDPVRALADRQNALLFLRRDAAPASAAAAFGWNAESLAKNERNYPPEFARLGLYGRIGAMPTGAPSPVPVIAPEKWRSSLPAGFRAALDAGASGKLESSTGDMVLEPRENRMRLVTPGTEAVALASGAAVGRVLSVDGVDIFSTISIHALDDLPLHESRSILLLHLTDVANSGMRFSSAKRTLLEDWGGLPLLVRRGRAEVTLALPNSPSIRVMRLTLNGAPQGIHKVESTGKGIRLQLDTTQALVYHITR